jgi:hypothetical protein
MVDSMIRKGNTEKRPLSLAPLSFDEAVTDILKIKPEPKCQIDSTDPKKWKCSVHGRILRERPLAAARNPPGPGHIRAFICPVSDKELRHVEK